MKLKLISLMTLFLAVLLVLVGCTVNLNLDDENISQDEQEVISNESIEREYTETPVAEEVEEEDSNICTTDSGESGFIMTVDGECYAPGENIPETDCIVSATGGCEPMNREDVEEVEEEIITENYSSDTGFSIEYPSGWRVVETELSAINYGVSSVTFTPPEIRNDHLWGINTYLRNEITTNELAARMGRQFGDNRTEEREEIDFNGFGAMKVTVRTTTVPDWEAITLYVLGEEYLYEILNGASQDYDFETFYRSFRLR